MGKAGKSVSMGKDSVRIRSYAKINLSLNISGTRHGRHLLDTVIVPVGLHDTITARKRKDGLVGVYMRGQGAEEIPPEQNNAVRAGEAFVRAFGTNGADIEIAKNIPQGAGLGGSSADAAGVLRAMEKLYGPADKTLLNALAASLGGDTPAMYWGGCARVSGTGEVVEAFSSPLVLHVLLAVPERGTSTAECYAKYDEFPDGLRADSARLCTALKRGEYAGVAKNVYNALERPACLLNEGTARALECLRALSPDACAVTGSGSAVFALFETPELCSWAKDRLKREKKLRTYVLQANAEAERRKFVLTANSPYRL